MKVVINKKYGGFGLSNKAVEACIALGMTVGDDEDHFKGKDFIRINGHGQGRIKYYTNDRHDNRFRCDPRLIQVVEQMGNEANGDYANLVVVDIPFDVVEGWHIEDHDGKEWVAENHITWGS